MVYELLKRCIEQKNEFLSTDMIQLQIEYFALKGKLTEIQKTELIDLITAVETPTEGDLIDNNLQE